MYVYINSELLSRKTMPQLMFGSKFDLFRWSCWKLQEWSLDFDDPVSISSEHEKIVKENECSGTRFLDVSALDQP